MTERSMLLCSEPQASQMAARGKSLKQSHEYMQCITDEGCEEAAAEDAGEGICGGRHSAIWGICMVALQQADGPLDFWQGEKLETYGQ